MSTEESLTEKYAVCFRIIAAAGEAKSNYIGAYRAAAARDFKKAESFIETGDASYAACHDIHLGLLSDFASGKNTEPPSQLLVHAEDQMSSAETLHEMAQALIDVYEKLAELSEKFDTTAQNEGDGER